MTEGQIRLFDSLGDGFGMEPIEDLEVVPGDVFELGKHRLMCGDSLSREDVAKLMAGEKADVVFTDPPYGAKKEKDGVTNDNQNQDEMLAFNKVWIPISFENLKTPGSWYCWGNDEVLFDIYAEILKPMKKLVGDQKLTYRNLISWDKGGVAGMLSGDLRMYVPSEKCLFVMTGRQTYGATKADYWEGFDPIRLYFKEQKEKTGLSTSKLVELFGVSTITHWWAVSQWEFPNRETYLRGARAVLEYLFPEEHRIREEYDRIREEYDRIREEFYKSRAYFDNTWKAMTDIWRIMPASAGTRERNLTDGFPTVKPIALCQQAIVTSSRPGDLILDMFGGSGSTMIAAEGIGRRAYLMEIEPKWCKTIVNRWQTVTGRKAVKIE